MMRRVAGLPWVMAMILVMLCVVGCTDKTKSTAQSGSADVPAAAHPKSAGDTGPGVLKIKGVSLGMNIDDVPAALRAAGVKLKASDEIIKVSGVKGVDDGYLFASSAGVYVHGNLEKAVTSMRFHSEVFAASEMTLDAFAEKLAADYGIPKFDGGTDGRQYNDPSGYRVRILAPSKKVTVERIPAAAK